MTRDALRILDANLNRAREALRMVEDYARFALDDPHISGQIKTLRHDLAAATAVLAQKAILHRDTPGDVGTAISTPAGADRQDLAATVVAAGKRFGEAARVIEELLKITDTAAARSVEQVRYAFYNIEARVALTLRPASTIHRPCIYVLITGSACRNHWFDTARQAIAGGTSLIQLREPELPPAELLGRARRLRELCHDHGVLLIVNDRPDIAIAAGADGVHVGQTDVPAADVRRLVGSRTILGVSTHNIEQLRQAKLAGADYAGVGPIFASSTKPRPEMANGLPGLPFAQAAAASGLLPTFAIAGITMANAAQVWRSGVTGLAVASAVTMSENPAAAVRDLLRACAEAAERASSL